jgi:RHS repeat-associated protein
MGHPPVLAKYTMGLGVDEPLAMLRGGVTSFYGQDGLGTVTSMFTTSAALAKTYTYDTFGKLTASTGTVVNPFQYTGREFDSETGLSYYRARYYDPSVGRFLSEDPIGFDGGINFYTYTRNQPTRYRDPSGLDVTVILYRGEGINVFDHVGIGVNSTATTGFYPASDDLLDLIRILAGRDVRGDARPDDPSRHREEVITIPTTPAHDIAVQAYIDNVLRNPGRYNVYNRSCVTFVTEALRAAGLRIPSRLTPSGLMEELK